MKSAFFLPLAIGACLLGSLAPKRLAAQAPTPGGDTRPASSRSLDLSVPASPAFVTLGVTPENVVRPVSPRLFAASLADAVDGQGHIQNGVAIDAAPFMATTTLQQYQESAMRRFFANTQVSLGTTKGQSSADEGLQAALGLHFTLANTSDPRLDKALLAFYSAVDEEARKNVPFTPGAAGAAAIDAEIARLLETKASEIRQTGDQGFLWTAAAALSTRSDSSTVRDLKYNGAAAWTSLSYGLGTTLQGILHFRSRIDEKIPNPKELGHFYEQDTYLTGMRLRASFGSVKGSLEGAATFTRRGVKTADGAAEPTDVAGLVSVVIEPRLTENLWLHLSLYSELAKDTGQNTIGFKTALKWGVSQNKQ